MGALPRHVPARLAEAVEREWGHDLVASWTTADWTGLDRRVADRIATLLGAPARTVAVGDSTSVMLFKLLAGAIRLRPARSTLVLEPTTFPTDAYVAQGVAETFDRTIRWCDPAAPAAALDDDVAVLCLSHVDFRTGAMFDLPGLSRAAHDAGALALWDLSHSTGAVPLDLTTADADLAVGCTYKYLNGGPGAPAYAYVAPHLHGSFRQPVTGWWGHTRPFALDRDYEPGAGVDHLAVGTPPVLALSALGAALDVFDGLRPEQLRAGSLSLTDLFIELVESRLPGTFELLTPREHERRGSQVSWRHPHAEALMRTLAGRRVVGDFREPDIARFGLAPLYVTHADVYDAVDRLVQTMDSGEHLHPA